MVLSVSIVHDDVEFRDAAADALRAAGCGVVTYSSSMTELNEIADHGPGDVLVAGVAFPVGMPNGVSLALVLCMKYPEMKVVFADGGEWAGHVAGIGALLWSLSPWTSTHWSRRSFTRRTQPDPSGTVHGGEEAS